MCIRIERIQSLHSICIGLRNAFRQFVLLLPLRRKISETGQIASNVKPIKLRQWSTKKKSPPKNQEMFSTTRPLSASVITLCKCLLVFTHGIRVEIFGHDPQNVRTIIAFPLIVLLDMPITLLLTVRSNEKKKAIVVPPTGLQDDGEEFYYISKMRTKSKTFKRRWTTNLDPNDCTFIPDRMLQEIKRKKRKCSF